MNPDVAFALTLADAADALTVARFRAADLRVETKPDLSPVSEADRAAEGVIRSLVASSGRGEGVLGEEFGDDGADATWIVDPIGGTTSYVRGIPVWATLLALKRDGVVCASLVSAPALGRRWWAARGKGAFADGVRCRVSAVSRASRTPRCRSRRPVGCRPGGRSSWSVRGRVAGWATSGSTAWSPRPGWTSPATA